MSSQEELLAGITQAIIDGDDHASAQGASDSLAAGIDALTILNDGLMAGADVVGAKFEAGEYFLPELMLAGRALKSAMAVVEPLLKAEYADDEISTDTGVVVIATVQTDIHDIGKNIVGSMLTASGFTVTDLGVDAPIKSIIEKAQELDANIIGLSALLTTSMPFMRELINLLDAMGERDRFKVMIGGASVTEEYAENIGADGTSPNAIEAVALAKELIRTQRKEREAQGA